ncbi:MAG: hypothetical protein GX101_03245 [Firmicutes bacterium]|jgi:hypothetical protein|nr:hypothetical protein [Bacillota bacterium]NLO65687.1 hypothetical protein [Bacillota bacterium]
MALDREIKQALEENSQWTGSADQMWDNIAAKLKRPPKPWWQRTPLWLGTAAAAAVIAVVLRTSLPPPEQPQPMLESAPRLQTFSAIMLDEEVRLKAGGQLEIPLDIYLHADQSKMVRQPRLTIWELNDGQEELVEERLLAEEDLFPTRVLFVSAPNRAGTYRLTVEGQITRDGQIYALYGSSEVTIEE